MHESSSQYVNVGCKQIRIFQFTELNVFIQITLIPDNGMERSTFPSHIIGDSVLEEQEHQKPMK